MVITVSFIDNTRNPTGSGGKIMIAAMNIGHRFLAGWGLEFLDINDGASILDCGCGGGANIKKLLGMNKSGRVNGVDYSEVSVAKARAVSRAEIAGGRCEIVRASVIELPFTDAAYDIVTAFETVYFWPDLWKSFGEIRRVLRNGGTFLICNECRDRVKGKKWTDKITGMTIYDGNELKNTLEETGFRDIQIHENGRGWLCVTARK